MTDFDEELRLDAEQDKREVAFIREQLPVEMKAAFSDHDLYYLMGRIVNYYYESGILEDHGEADDEEVEIDLEQVAEALLEQCKKDGRHEWTAEQLFFVVHADLDFMETQTD